MDNIQVSRYWFVFSFLGIFQFLRGFDRMLKFSNIQNEKIVMPGEGK